MNVLNTLKDYFAKILIPSGSTPPKIIFGKTSPEGHHITIMFRTNTNEIDVHYTYYEDREHYPNGKHVPLMRYSISDLAKLENDYLELEKKLIRELHPKGLRLDNSNIDDFKRAYKDLFFLLDSEVSHYIMCNTPEKGKIDLEKMEPFHLIETLGYEYKNGEYFKIGINWVISLEPKMFGIVFKWDEAGPMMYVEMKNILRSIVRFQKELMKLMSGLIDFDEVERKIAELKAKGFLER